MAKRTLEIEITGDSAGVSRAFSGVVKDAGTLDRKLRTTGKAITQTGDGLVALGGNAEKAGRIVTQFGGVLEKSAAPAAAAWAKQKQSLSGLARFAKRATLITGGLAAAGISYGLKLNAQWETNEKSFGTLLGSLEKGKKLMEDLRQVSSKSYLRLTDFQEVSKGLLGVGVNAKRVVPLMKGVNAAIVAVGGDSEKLTRVTEALGQIKARGKVSAREMQRLGQAGLPINRILQKAFKLTGDQVANIGKESLDADKVLKVISERWTKKYGPGLEEAMKAGGAQVQLLQKNFEGLLRISTQGIYQQLAKKVLPAANRELEKLTDIIGSDKLTGGQKLNRLEKTFDQLVDKAGLFARDAAPKIAEAIDRFAPIFARGIEKMTPLAAEAMSRMIVALSPAIAKGAGTIAKSFVTGFMKSDVLGKLLMGSWLFTKMGGVAAMRAAGMGVGQRLAGGVAAGMSAGMASTLGSAQMGAGVMQSTANGLIVAGSSMAKSMVGAMARAIPGLVASYQVIDIVGTSITEGAGAGARKAGFAVGGAVIGGIAGTFLGGQTVLGAALGSALGSAAEMAFRPEALQEKIKKQFGDAWRSDLSIDARLGIQDIDNEDLKNALRRAQTLPALTGKNLFPGIWDDLGPDGKQVGNAIASARKLIDQHGFEISFDLVQRDPQAINRIRDNIQQMLSGRLTKTADIERVFNQTGRIIERTMGTSSAQAKENLAKNMRAAADAMKKNLGGMRNASARETKRINGLFRKADMLAPATRDARKFGKQWAEGMTRGRKVVGAGLDRMVNRMKGMTPKARQAVFQSWQAQMKEDVKGGRLREKAFKDARSKVLSTFTGLKTGAGRSAKNTGEAVQKGTKKGEKGMEDLAKTSKRTASTIKRSISSIGPVATTGYSNLASATNTALQAFGVTDKAVSLRSGGHVPFGAGQKTVTAYVSPGERVDYKGRTWIVPGRPEPRDSVSARLPAGARVYTFDGQVRLAMGESAESALRNQAPHFQGGGLVSAEDRRIASAKLPRPLMKGGSRLPTRIGNQGLTSVRRAAVKYLAENMNVIPRGPIVAIGKALQRMGYEVGEHPAFGGVAPVHTTNSYHYRGRALDINDDVPPFGHGSSEPQSLDWLNSQLKKIPHVELLWRVKDHFDHLHFAQRTGGVIPSFRGGGKMTPAKMRRQGMNRTKAPWLRKYKRWGPNMLATLAAYVGLPNPGLMSQIAKGESNGNPGATNRNTNGTIDRGLWQINSVHGFGGDPFDPMTNALQAKRVYDMQGVGAWYAPPTGRAGKVDPEFMKRIMYSPAQLKHARKASSKQFGRVKGLWGAIGRKDRRATPAAKKRARLAGRNARLARRLAKSGDAAGSLAARNRSRRFLKKAWKGVTGVPNRGGGGGGGGRGGGGGGGGRGGGSGAGGGGAAASKLLSQLPESIQSQLQPMVAAGGLSWQQRRDLLENALGIAETTEGVEDDRQVYGLIIRAEQGRKRHARKVFARETRGLQGFSQKGIANRTKRNRQIERALDKIKPPKGKSKLTAAQRKRRNKLLAEKKRNDKRIREYERRTARRDRAFDTFNEADAAIRSARESRRNLQEQESGAELAEELKALREEIAKQTAAMERGRGVDQRTLTRALADLLSGQLAGRADPPAHLGFSPEVNF